MAFDGHFIDISPENIENEHLCCIIRTKKPHPGVEAKREWLKEQLPLGHVFRKLDERATVFIEYAPLETAWTPIEGGNFLYIYCLWVDGAFKGRGYGSALMQSCIEDAKRQGRSGVCMLGAKKQKHWLADQSFAKKFGFETVDSTHSGYELLALSFDGTTPQFTPAAKRETIDDRKLTVFYDMQCPFMHQYMATLQLWCAQHDIPVSFIKVDSLEAAKSLPCVFNNCAVFYEGRFQTVNLPDTGYIERFLRK